MIGLNIALCRVLIDVHNVLMSDVLFGVV